ncbi:MAG: transcriptional repressor LexA [Pseudomonadota bacterium]
MLTPKQRDLLLLIDRRLRQDGVSPSFEEMKEALGLKSKSGIHRLISALEERGFLRRLPHRARALEVIKLPDGFASKESRTPAETDSPMPRQDLSTGIPQTSEATVVRGPFRVPARTASEGEGRGQAVQIPLHGKIAAGTPIEALENIEAHLTVPPECLSFGEHYALEIDGDSMVDAGILDGDLVMIQKCDTARDGEIVVALIDQDEATLKILRREPNQIALEPANPAHSVQVYSPDHVQIQGRLVGLIRRYH